MASLSDLYLRFAFDIVARDAFGHLHWGHWRDVPRDARFLPEAQASFAQLLLDIVPSAARRVMDVGCGLGGIARMLVKSGRSVTAVSPRADHCARIQAAAEPGITVHCGRFEDLEPRGDHDLLLFAESLAFFVRQAPAEAPASVAIWAARAAAHLRAGGHVLAADLVSEPLARAIEATPGFVLRQQLDVTDEVRFTVEALQRMVDGYVRPYQELLLDVLDQRNAALRVEVERALAEVDHVPLRRLFAGRMIEQEMLVDRRYRVFLLQHVGPA